MRHFRPVLILIAAALIPGASAGCGDVDWNWDTSSWKQRRRVVRPAKNPTPAENAGPQQNAPTGDPAPGTGGEHVAAQAASQPARSTVPRGKRLYYNLYLASAGTKDTATDQEQSRIELHNTGARTCASLLEMLYLPLGRSGSPDECYLIYERSDELAAARDYAPKLDIRPTAENAPVAGPEAPLANGVACFGHILDSGALVDRSVIELCRRNLAEAAQSSQLADHQRWAAAILAARLASEYEYDYAAARSFCDQARRFCEADSIERMTADWWRADTFVQQGKTPDAIEAYEDLIDAHFHRRSGSNVIARAEAIVKKLGGR